MIRDHTGHSMGTADATLRTPSASDKEEEEEEEEEEELLVEEELTCRRRRAGSLGALKRGRGLEDLVTRLRTRLITRP